MFKKFLNLGTSGLHSYSDNNKIKITNGFALVGVWGSILYSLIYSILDLKINSFSYLIASILFSVVLLINYFNKTNVARVYLILLLNSIFLLTASIIPENTSHYLYFIVLAIIPIIIFDFDDKKTLFAILPISFICFIIARFFPIVMPFCVEIDPSKIYILEVIDQSFIILLNLIVVFLFVNQKIHLEQKLKHKLEENVNKTEQIQLAQRITNLGYYTRDFEENKAYYSENILNILGLDERADTRIEAITGMIFYEDREYVEESYNNIFQSGQDMNIDYRIVRPDFKIRWISDIAKVTKFKKGVPLRMIGTIQDITDRKNIENELANTRDNLNAIISSLDDVVIEMTKEGRYVNIWANNEKHLLIPSKKLIGKLFKDVYNEEIARPFMNGIKKALETKKSNTYEYKLKINNEYRWFEAKFSVVEDSENVTILIRDVTQLVNSVQKLVESEKKLKELNQSKDMFFSIIAHDMRNPLAAFIMSLELMSNNLHKYDDNQKLNALKKLFQNAKNLLEMFENLLNWSRAEQGRIPFDPSPIYISDFLNKFQSYFENLLNQKSINLITIYPDDLFVIADKNMIETILRNLITNAIKFSNKDSNVTISLEDSGAFYTFKVIDQGIGINSENIEKLFKIESQFTTLGTAFEKGSGLGLAICKKFVEAHNGNIWIESEIGKGSSFNFTISKNL